ncbi:LysR family transcriptional regulator [Aurantimonas endophytica]|uniref:DNA-binding transcriptional LysR family regulator n=1 Tax=Aurantimonas endophytica TaxID=1522175 RepID=A0A7W6MQ64_9HYPH|nr:LysR family transcriptional regulator [Aurantimonas endophytica]MBB4003680.1 DNA-binding transcriptional LysR family regulator [Aurantimonas endophytica]MCO6404536.1 LysR family transcriptional regulator [Aurantimonas endophytica]
MDLAAALRAFTRTVERGSITAAAQDLSISQPAVSKHIANLERRVRARLLERSARLVRPTPEGQALYDASWSALASIDAAVEGLHATTGRIEGTIRVHAPSCIGGKYLHPLLMQFQRIHPNVSFELMLENRTVDLVFENFDMAFIHGRPSAQDLIIRRLGLARRILVASPAFLAEYGPVDTLERLSQVPLVTTARSMTTKNRLALLFEGSSTELEVRSILQSNDAHVIGRTLLEGHAAGPVQHLLVTGELASGRLVRILPDWEVRPTELFLAYPSVKFMRPAVRAFADFVLDNLQTVEGIDKA